jgi:hypothetical protein
MIAWAEFLRRWEASGETLLLCDYCPLYSRGCPDPGGNTVAWYEFELDPEELVRRARFCHILAGTTVQVEELFIGGTADGHRVANGSASETLVFAGTAAGGVRAYFEPPPAPGREGATGIVIADGGFSVDGQAEGRIVARGGAWETLYFSGYLSGILPNISIVTFGSSAGGGVKYRGAAQTTFSIRIIDR